MPILSSTSAKTLVSLGSGSQDLGGGFVGVLLEVLVEEAAKLVDLVLEGGSGGPAVLGVEQLGGDASTSFKDEVNKLGSLFNENFKKYSDQATPEVLAAAPQIQ